MGIICGKSDQKVSSDEREAWHWETYIGYIPGINVAYGGIRAGVYYCKAGSKGDENYNPQPIKECWKSMAGIIAGALTLVVPGALSRVATPSITSKLGRILLGLFIEMFVGGMLQTVILAIADIATSWKEWKSKSSNEKEKILNDEVFNKIPFLGFMYSLIRCVYKCIKRDCKEAKESCRNTCTNGISSACGLWAAYGLHQLVCCKKATEFFWNLREPLEWADDLGRLVFKLSDGATNAIQYIVLFAARGAGKAVGDGGVRWVLDGVTVNRKVTHKVEDDTKPSVSSVN